MSAPTGQLTLIEFMLARIDEEPAAVRIALRRIVALHSEPGDEHDLETLRCLASAYIDHPDYDQDWMP